MLFRRFMLTEKRMNQYYDELMEIYVNKNDNELRKIEDTSHIYCEFPMTVLTGLSAFIFPAMLTYFASHLEIIEFKVGYVVTILFMTIIFAMILISGYISNSIKNKVASRILEDREKSKLVYSCASTIVV